MHCTSASFRDSLRQYLADRGIETRSYFLPIHLQPSYRSWYAMHRLEIEDADKTDNFWTDVGSLPNADKYGSIGLNLPTYSQLVRDDL